MSDRDACLCGQKFSAHNKNFCITNVNRNEDKMSNFKMIEKLGLKVVTYQEMSCEFVVNAKDLEPLLQSAQVVYGSFCKRQDGKNTSEWSYLKSEYDTHTALVIGVTSIKKQTKAEAAFEFVSDLFENSHVRTRREIKEQAKRILEMKDSE